MISGVLIFILWGAVPALAQLPPEIQADVYLLRAEQAIDEREPARALVEIDKIILLQKEHELDLPDEFHFRYAKAAAAADLPEQALEAVVTYLTLAGREGRHYEEALELMNQVQDAIQGDKEPQAASNESSPPAPAAEQGLVEVQLETGGTQEAQEEKAAPLNVSGTTDVQLEQEPETALGGEWKIVGIPPKDANVEPELADVLSDRQAAAQTVNCEKWKSWSFWRKEVTLEFVTACLDAGADPNKGTHTPLHLAAMYSSDPRIVKALVTAGADLEARTRTYNGRMTPLHKAAAYTKSPQIIMALIAAGASLEARTKGLEYTPLHKAAAYTKSPQIIMALIAAGASLEARTKGLEYTPLHLAAEYNKNPEVIRALLAAGANPNARARKGKKPLDVARKRNRSILAAAGGTRKQSSGGGGLGALIAGVAVGTALGAAGASEEEALAGGTIIAEQVRTGQPSTGDNGPASTAGGAAGGGSCQIPGYPSPPGGVANLGLSWCPASVDFQLRAFALQAAGAQCAIATGSSSTPEQIQARRREIKEACGRLAALSARDGIPCRCPAGYGP